MFKIALRNIFRNKRRSLLTGLSINFAVMIVIYMWSFLSGVIDTMFDNTIRLTSGHVRILNSEYVKREKMMPLEANIQDYEAVAKVAEAKAICSGCPVRQECLDYALDSRQAYGIWGGKTPTERRRMK